MVERRTLSRGEEVLSKMTAGSVAGLVGVSTCYPIDFAKTRLQKHGKEYSGMLDVLRKARMKGGAISWYDGLRPNLAGIIPEKGLKLAVFDIVRDRFKRPDGSVAVKHDVVAAVSAAVAQVIVTTPMEIVKIRCQLSGRSAISVIRELGLRGCYRGYLSTLSRDVWFNLWFFPLQATWKQEWIKPEDSASAKLGKSFTAGICSGMLAAAISTPFDVVKTRLQAQTAKGSIPAVARQVVHAEGLAGLFLGCGPRVYAIAPLFGIAIAVYDVQKRWLISMGFDMP